MLISLYSKIKEKCDLDYRKPSENNFVVREFDKIKWSNVRSRNFFVIIKILAENGYCNINEIKDKDGLSQTPKNRKTRHDVYDLLIKGKPDKFRGLLDKRIIEVEDKENWKTKRNNRYRLSLFGMLYSIHLFSKDDVQTGVNLKYNNQIQYKIKSVTKYKKNILDTLVENYSDMLPLVFGKWSFMITEFGTLINFLVSFANFSKNFEDMLHQNTLINSDAIFTKDWKSKTTVEEELTVLVFAYIALQEPQYRIKYEKDKDVLNLYKQYIKNLRKKYESELLRIKFKEASFEGKYDKAKKLGKEFIESQGLSAETWLQNLDVHHEIPY